MCYKSITGTRPSALSRDVFIERLSRSQNFPGTQLGSESAWSLGRVTARWGDPPGSCTGKCPLVPSRWLPLCVCPWGLVCPFQNHQSNAPSLSAAWVWGHEFPFQAKPREKNCKQALFPGPESQKHFSVPWGAPYLNPERLQSSPCPRPQASLASQLAETDPRTALGQPSGLPSSPKPSGKQAHISPQRPDISNLIPLLLPECLP